MRKMLIALTVLFTGALPLAAGLEWSPQQAEPRKPEPPKAAQSIAGKWTMTVNTNNGTTIATLDARLDGRKLTGTVSSQMGLAPIAGEYADGKLTFSLTMQGADGSSMDLSFVGAMKENGTLAGTLSTVTGTTLDWTAERTKTDEQGTPSPAKPGSAAGSIAGKWAMSLDISGMGAATPTLDLRQEGEKISGTYTGRYGTYPLQGTLKDRKLNFAFTMNAEGTDVTMSFAGEVTEDGSLKGTAEIPGLGSATWTAKRQ
jgi:hypothetical protein